MSTPSPGPPALGGCPGILGCVWLPLGWSLLLRKDCVQGRALGYRTQVIEGAESSGTVLELGGILGHLRASGRAHLTDGVTETQWKGLAQGSGVIWLVTLVLGALHPCGLVAETFPPCLSLPHGSVTFSWASLCLRLGVCLWEEAPWGLLTNRGPRSLWAQAPRRPLHKSCGAGYGRDLGCCAEVWEKGYVLCLGVNYFSFPDLSDAV